MIKITHWWEQASLIVILLNESISSIAVIRLIATGDIFSHLSWGNFNLNDSPIFDPDKGSIDELKGSLPANITYNKTPQAQTSTEVE